MSPAFEPRRRHARRHVNGITEDSRRPGLAEGPPSHPTKGRSTCRTSRFVAAPRRRPPPRCSPRSHSPARPPRRPRPISNAPSPYVPQVRARPRGPRFAGHHHARRRDLRPDPPHGLLRPAPTTRPAPYGRSSGRAGRGAGPRSSGVACPRAANWRRPSTRLMWFGPVRPDSKIVVGSSSQPQTRQIS